jgi:hypothetical protein
MPDAPDVSTGKKAIPRCMRAPNGASKKESSRRGLKSSAGSEKINKAFYPRGPHQIHYMIANKQLIYLSSTNFDKRRRLYRKTGKIAFAIPHPLGSARARKARAPRGCEASSRG